MTVNLDMGQRTHNSRFHLWPYRAKDDLNLQFENLDLKVYYQFTAENIINPLACKEENSPYHQYTYKMLIVVKDNLNQIWTDKVSPTHKMLIVIEYTMNQIWTDKPDLDR